MDENEKTLIQELYRSHIINFVQNTNSIDALTSIYSAVVLCESSNKPTLDGLIF